jgi:enoyl-CoA hydratase/carnithine racemase
LGSLCPKRGSLFILRTKRYTFRHRKETLSAPVISHEIDMPDNNLLIRNDCGGVAILTLNAPTSINALSEEMLRALSTNLDEIATDRAVKAVILRSEGDHFCAGHNLKEMTARRSDEDGGFQYFQDLFATCSEMMLRVVRLPQPVIAEV